MNFAARRRQRQEQSMKIITVSSSEQGVGKSVIAVHLAYYLREIGKSVLVVDLAHTGNTSWTLSEFGCDLQAPDLFGERVRRFGGVGRAQKLMLIQSKSKNSADRWRCGDFALPLNLAAERLKENLASLAFAFDYCVIDTAPGECKLTRAAVVVSDYTVMPVAAKPGAVNRIDRQSVESFVHHFSAARIGLLVSRFRLADPNEKAIADGVARACPNTVLKAHVPECDHISDALIRRRAAWAAPTRSVRKSAESVHAAMACIVANASRGLDG
jgi:chromosome partitioning protein